MHNFTTKPVMALILNKGLSLAAGTTRISRVDYEALIDLQQAREHVAAEIEAIKEKARQEGLALGRADAAKEMLDQVGEMKTSMELWVKEVDEKLVHIVGACVEEVVRNVDAIDVIRSSVEKSLKNLQDVSKVTARVHSENIEVVKQVLAELAPNLTATVVADDTLGSSDCQLDTPNGLIDLRVGAQMGALRANLGIL